MKKAITHDNKRVKYGIIFSYSLIILNALYSIIIIPFIIKSIGSAQYGVYKTIASLSSSLLVLDLGLGNTLIRFIAKFRTNNNERGIRNLVKIAFFESAVISIIMAVSCIIVFLNIQNIYQNGLSVEEIIIAKKLFLFLSINLVLHVFESVLYGIISGYNYFDFSNGLKFARIVLRIIATFVLLGIFKDSLILVIIDLSLTTFLIVFEFLFIVFKIKFKLNLKEKFWDLELFLSTFKYTFLILITTIAAQINSNMDNVIVGSFLGSESVAIYSIGLVFFAMFENLSTSISGTVLPTITNSLSRDPSGKEAENLVIKFGRIQFMLLGAALAGFIVLGRDFINLWVGAGFDDAYFISLILMVPALFELCINVCLSILRAKNMLGFRTIVISVSTLVNFAITFFGIKYGGYYWAAVGTGISFLFGSVVVMGFYYYKKLNINLFVLYKKIFNKTFICIVFSTILIVGTSRMFDHNWLTFLFNVAIFCISYFVSLCLYGFNDEEKRMFRRIKK